VRWVKVWDGRARSGPRGEHLESEEARPSRPSRSTPCRTPSTRCVREGGVLWCGAAAGFTEWMRAGKVLASAPRWVRGLWWAGSFAIYFGFTTWFVLRRVVRASVGVGVGVVVGGAVGVVVVLSESRQLRRLARRIGWFGDPAALQAVRIDVDAGGVPVEDAQRRELARRYARQAYDNRVGVRFSAACFATAALIFITLPALTGDGGEVVGSVIAAAMSVVICPGLVRIPRYRRVLRVLTPDDATWATQPAATCR